MPLAFDRDALVSLCLLTRGQTFARPLEHRHVRRGLNELICSDVSTWARLIRCRQVSPCPFVTATHRATTG